MALTLPHTMDLRLSFEHGAILDGLPGWREFFALPVEDRIAVLADPGPAGRMDERAQSDEAGMLRFLADWGRLVIAETFADANRGLEGRSVADVAAERGRRHLGRHAARWWWPTACAPGSRCPSPTTDEDWAARAEHLADPGPWSAGRMPAPTSTPCAGPSTRPRCWPRGCAGGACVTLEEAVRLLTDVPARLYGLVDRGRVAEGYWADLVVFDPERVGPGPMRTRDDLPGGASRLYAGATGMEHVLVNGTEVVADDTLTGALPGTVLRSGTDTRTVAVPGRA